MRTIRIQMLVILSALLSACSQDEPVQQVVLSAGDEVNLKLAECRAAGRDSQRDSVCANAIAEREEAAWRSKGRGIQIKPETHP